MHVVSLNPATGKIIKKFSPSSRSELERKVRASRRAFLFWSSSSPDERIRYFKKLQKVIHREIKAVGRLIHEEMGKPISEALGEVDDILDGISYQIGVLRKVHPFQFSTDQKVWPKTKAKIIFVPHGVVGIIASWNFPFGTPMWNIVPVLLAGNTVILKPSEYTTLVGLKIKELFLKAGFPQGVLDVVMGAGDVGRDLVRSAVDKVYFTGSVSAGQDVLKNSGVKPVTVELGGNDPAIVLKDAHIKLAASGIVWSRLTNNGQCCSSTKRVYVEREVFPEFFKEVVGRFRRAKPGKDFGPLVRGDALRRVDLAVKNLIRGGAKLVSGGQKMKGPGFWYKPTILAMPKGKISPALREEIFGPVIPIQPVQSAEEAVKLANDSSYGLTASVWTRNLKKGRAILKKLEAGMVYLNETNFALPGGEYWGGWKNSGFVTTENKIMNAMKRQIVIEYRGEKSRFFWK